jgi:hypothetical protein
LLLVTPCIVLVGFAGWAAVWGGGGRNAAILAVASLLLGAGFGAAAFIRRRAISPTVWRG